MADLRFDAHERAREKQRHDLAIAEHLAYHGPGLTFGELAIGERFQWAAPLNDAHEPYVKAGATLYTWSRGAGTAEDYYRVERCRDA